MILFIYMYDELLKHHKKSGKGLKKNAPIHV